jgi:quercetin 2,3-dioxygenase
VSLLFALTQATTFAFSSAPTININMTPSIKVIPKSKLFVSEPDPRWFGNGPNDEFNPEWTNENWLKSNFHFNFAEYRNPANPSFGVLKVMNDDLVQPHRGFGSHPHGDMEIITYIVHGELTHEDSIGTVESLGRGSIQFMTAGTGIVHSEFNHGDKPLRFVQTWINPRGRGLKPNYGSCTGSTEGRKNKLQHLVSDSENKGAETPVKIAQDVDAYSSELDLGAMVLHELPKGRQAYLLCLEGKIKVNGKELNCADACEITGGGNIEIEATQVEDTENGKVAHFLMFTMKEVPGSGRKDV